MDVDAGRIAANGAGRAAAGATWGIAKKSGWLAVLFLLSLAALVSMLAGMAPSAAAGIETGKPLAIAVLVSSDRTACFVPGRVAAIRHFATRRAAEINRRGGIDGHRLELVFLDDFESEERLKVNVASALADERLIGMVGLADSTRGKAVVDDIARSGVPFISEISRGDIYAAHPTIFSLVPSIRDEVGVVRRLMADRGATRPVFVGFAGNLYVSEYARQLAEPGEGPGLAAIHLLPERPDYVLDQAAADQAIAAIRQSGADFVLLALNSGPGAQFARKLAEAGLTVPVFVVLGRIGRIDRAMGATPYPGAMLELAREGVPNAYNERLMRRIWAERDGTWIFNDSRSQTAPAACKDEPDTRLITDVQDDANRRAIGRGVQYADMIEMIATAAIAKGTAVDLAELRRAIAGDLAGYRAERRIFHGWWQDWAFTAGRSLSDAMLVAERRAPGAAITLAARQYAFGATGLRPLPVMSISVDMIRIFKVDSNERTFYADFYLSFRDDAGLDISDIEFTNAVRSEVSRDALVSFHRIDAAPGSNGGLKLYKVAGKFYFEPDLGDYPFDEQRFSLSFQPSDASHPFLVQPPPAELGRRSFDTDGWRPLSRYVGADQDVITALGSDVAEERLIQLYKYNATWVMARISTDYALRVVLPLIVILLVTYLSVFIPEDRLESVVAIQVTALLSAIALYLAIPKVDNDEATVSDKIFVACYGIITLTLALSILRARYHGVGRMRTATLAGLAQLVLVPLLTLMLAGYVAVTAMGHGEGAGLASAWLGQ
ncbi:MAG: ABC transporter substrate-binding protein [Hyphomicrobiaceae bacterium]